jgi:hypothetical protein
MFHPSRPAPSPPTASSPYSQGPTPPHGAPPQGPRIQGPSSGSFSSPFSQPFIPVTGPPHSQVPNQIANQGSSPYMQQPHSQVSSLAQHLGGMSVGEQKSSGSLSDPLPPPSFSAPSQPSSTPNYPAPPTWQPAQRRVYPDAYNGSPPTVSSLLLCSLWWNS